MIDIDRQTLTEAKRFEQVFKKVCTYLNSYHMQNNQIDHFMKIIVAIFQILECSKCIHRWNICIYNSCVCGMVSFGILSLHLWQKIDAISCVYLRLNIDITSSR